MIEGGRIVEQGDVFEVFTRPQHAVTRSFLADETGRALPPYRRRRGSRRRRRPASQAVVRIGFRGPHATDPVLVAACARSRTSKSNILAGAVDEIAGRPFGTLVVGVPRAIARRHARLS